MNKNKNDQFSFRNVLFYITLIKGIFADKRKESVNEMIPEDGIIVVYVSGSTLQVRQDEFENCFKWVTFLERPILPDTTTSVLRMKEYSIAFSFSFSFRSVLRCLLVLWNESKKRKKKFRAACCDIINNWLVFLFLSLEYRMNVWFFRQDSEQNYSRDNFLTLT